MKLNLVKRGASALVLLACLGLITHGAWAQGGGGGGRGGGGRGSGGMGGGGMGGRGTGASGGMAGRAGTSARTGTGATTAGANQLGAASITVDPETRQLIVITDTNTANYISQVVSNLDRPAPQVLIKVVFLEVTHNNSSDIGVEGTFSKKINSTPSAHTPTSAVVSNLFGLTPGLPGGSFPVPPGGGLYSILGKDYEVTLRAIAQAGKLEVLSRPSILTRNNQPATISLGQTIPLISSTRFDTFGNQINTVSYQPVGIILQVTPFITSDGLVEMIVSPTISGLADKSQWVVTSSGPSGSVSSPVINSRSADTVVVVPDGQTVVIGGLMDNQNNVSTSKIPILGDIPLLGAAFRHKTKSSTKTELLIFLTPIIVMRPTQLAALSANERQSAEKSFSEEDLNRFLDRVPAKDKVAPAAPAPGSGKSKAPKYSEEGLEPTRDPGSNP